MKEMTDNIKVSALLMEMDVECVIKILDNSRKVSLLIKIK